MSSKTSTHQHLYIVEFEAILSQLSIVKSTEVVTNKFAETEKNIARNRLKSVYKKNLEAVFANQLFALI